MVFLVILSHLVGHAWLYFMSLYHINIREETLQHATFSLQYSLVFLFCCSMYRNCCFGFLLPHLFSSSSFLLARCHNAPGFPNPRVVIFSATTTTFSVFVVISSLGAFIFTLCTTAAILLLAVVETLQTTCTTAP